MADSFSSLPETFNIDESPRAPTFVQIHAPATAGIALRLLSIVGVGIVVVAALGWAAYRLTINQVGPVQAAPTVIEPLSSPMPADLNSELVRITIDAAVLAPFWSRQSLMDSISTFDASVPDRPVFSGAPPADTRDVTQPGSYEVLLRLGKGDTIGSALQKLGFEAEAIADAVSALTPHVRLKRLPIGLGMKLRIRPSAEEGAKPILQALTLQPEGRREITVERDDYGQYVLER